MNYPEEVEKAKELVDKFIEPTQRWSDLDGWVDDIDNAKECANICADEFIKFAEECALWDLKDEWERIKSEIEKL